MSAAGEKRSGGARAALWIGSLLLVLVLTFAALVGVAALGPVQFELGGSEYTIAVGWFGRRVRAQGYRTFRMRGSNLHWLGIGRGWFQVRVNYEPSPE